MFIYSVHFDSTYGTRDGQCRQILIQVQSENQVKEIDP